MYIFYDLCPKHPQNPKKTHKIPHFRKKNPQNSPKKLSKPTKNIPNFT